MLRRLFPLALAVAALVSLPAPALAVLYSPDTKTITRGDTLQARQFRLPESHISGPQSMRQTLTVWQVTAGTWNGQNLQGLSLVLVRSISDKGPSRPMTNCYISHLANAAQRAALLSAYEASQDLTPVDVTSWRVEPAVIRLEITGETVVLHLGLVA